MKNNNPIITVLLLVSAIMSTVGYIQSRVENPDDLQKAVTSLSDNVEKLANTDVEMVIAVKETRTEVTQDQAFELLLGKGKGGVEVELDGEGRYWLIETNKEEK
jgi:acyl-CoA synthetase (NDP forming)